MSKKKVLVALIVLLTLGLAFPVINLIVGAPTNTTLSRKANVKAALGPMVKMLEAKCANCHTAEPKLPFYASLPIVEGIVQADIKKGRRFFDMLEDLVGEKSGPATEAALAKIEHEITEGAMPPGKYIALHWDARMSAADKEKLLQWVKKTRVAHYAPQGLPREVQEAMVHPIPRTAKVDSAKAALGRKLYHDKRLSGDDTISCASCHDLDKGGTDQARVSTGIRAQKGGINSPTTFNSQYQFKQFWDGRATTLQDQAGGPPLNPIEMGGSWAKIVEKLKADAAFAEAFTKVYPEGFSAKTITHAIAEFERTLDTPDSPFDNYLRGKKDALDAQQQKGWALFQSQGCQTCHVGKLLGGQSFEEMGRAADYFAKRGGKLTDADAGRHAVTKKQRDKHRFKVPTLRNVALTFPYFHDGSAKTLEAAVKTMAQVQLGQQLTDAEVKSMVAFLGSLNGKYKGKAL